MGFLLDLPNELLLSISTYLEESGIGSLLRTNRRLRELLTSELNQHATQICRNVYRRGNLKIRCTLHWAAWRGHEALFQLLLDKDVSIECPADAHHCHSQETVLHFAAFQGSETIVKLLLDKGANINQTDETGTTALHFAAMRGNEEVVRLLLENGAKVTAVDGAGLSIMSKALKSYDHHRTKRNLNVFKLLLENNADIDARDKEGATALHLAVKHMDLEILDILLESGANPYIKSKDGETALDWALIQTFDKLSEERLQKAYQVVKFLQEKGLIPTLGGKFYDVRRPRGKREYWKLACGSGIKNQAKSIIKTWTFQACPTEAAGRYYRQEKIKANRAFRGTTINYYNYNL